MHLGGLWQTPHFRQLQHHLMPTAAFTGSFQPLCWSPWWSSRSSFNCFRLTKCMLLTIKATRCCILSLFLTFCHFHSLASQQKTHKWQQIKRIILNNSIVNEVKENGSLSTHYCVKLKTMFQTAIFSFYICINWSMSSQQY